MVFLGLVLVPVVRKPPFEKVASRLIEWTGTRFRTIGWIVLSTLVATGIINLAYRFGWAGLIDGSIFRGQFGSTLGHKLFFVGAIFITSAIHDFYVGPKATELWERGETDNASKYRKRASIFGRINLVLALFVLFFAIMLVRGTPW